jgi:hypothetical protein
MQALPITPSRKADRMRPTRVGIAMDEKQQLKQLAKLGIDDFETVADVERMQRDLLGRLKRSSIDPDRYAGLEYCRADRCGRVNCLEACAFGAFKRRLTDVRAAVRLLNSARGPFHEIRVSRALWSRPFGKLDKAPIAAARQLNRHALDRLYDCEIIAVGSFNVAPSPAYQEKRWICEIHQVVAGANKDNLERVFSTKRSRGEICTRKRMLFVDYLRVKEIQALGPIVSEVLKYDLSGWQHPWRPEMSIERPNKPQRREFYAWLLSLSPRARLMRYGCNRQFKNLERKPRIPPPPRTARKHPYPFWLEPYFFGSVQRERMGTDPNCVNYIGPIKKGPPRLDRRLEIYFKKFDESYFDDLD